MTTQSLTRTAKGLLLSAVLLATSCGDLDVGNLNGIDVDEFLYNPTPGLITEASVGLLIGNRANKGNANGFVANVGILGREAYNFDPADPRFRSELLEAENLNPGSPVFGGNHWIAPYTNIRNAHLLLHALDIVVDMSEEDKQATRGFARTIIALEFLSLATTRWNEDIPIDVDREIFSGELAPLEPRAAVLQQVIDLLDESVGNLQAGGASFPFALSSGYAGFDTPATFIEFNRAIKARASAYREDWNAVLTALDESFYSLDEDDLDVGVYHVYSTGPGDVAIGLSSPSLYVHPSVTALAELKPDGNIDDRVAQKVVQVEPNSVTSGDNMYTSDKRFAAYQSPTSRLPIIRNEELILLRAEAHIGLGQYDDALPLINFIRTESGGLAPIDSLDAVTAVDELLQQRFYSLLFEGGHRWIDMRRFGRLDALLDLDENAGLYVHESYPLPIDEQNARGLNN